MAWQGNRLNTKPVSVMKTCQYCRSYPLREERALWEKGREAFEAYRHREASWNKSIFCSFITLQSNDGTECIATHIRLIFFLSSTLLHQFILKEGLHSVTHFSLWSADQQDFGFEKGFPFSGVGGGKLLQQWLGIACPVLKLYMVEYLSGMCVPRIVRYMSFSSL